MKIQSQQLDSDSDADFMRYIHTPSGDDAFLEFNVRHRSNAVDRELFETV